MQGESPLEAHTLREDLTHSITFSFEKIKDSFFLPKLTRFINRYFYNLPKIGIGATLDRYTNTFSIYSSKKDKLRYQNYEKDAIFANFGSGAFNHNRWKNFDFPGVTKYYKNLLGKSGKDYIPINLNEQNLTIPFKTESVELIYFSHVLEHLNKENGKKVFFEFFRILKPGGILRVAIPDIDKGLLHSKIIFQQDNIEKLEKEKSTSSSILHAFFKASEIPNSDLLDIAKNEDFNLEKIETKLKKLISDLEKFDPCNPDYHIAYWNEIRLLELSKLAGFSRIYPLLRGHTFAEPFKNLCAFDISEPHISMYFELVK